MPVSSLIWERLGLTMVLSVGSLLFIWAVAFPVGVYSAVRQYSPGDYVATFFGFLGVAIPNFLLALVLMYVAFKYFNQSVGGLFSPEYRDAPWGWGKVGDLLGHLWIPIIIIGTDGTAGLIRIMRANLLDELRKPYVVTARAKGLPEWKLLLKYPVRVALNPFISTVGWVLPGLVSGSAIVSIVLSLPTTGPILLRALLSQDMYLAASFLLMLSILTVVGTLLSDLLLAWLDPRIRYE
jgi:peptide/nickel transport system permease protein